LGFPETIPDYSTVWRFRERLKLERKYGRNCRDLKAKGLKG